MLLGVHMLWCLGNVSCCLLPDLLPAERGVTTTPPLSAQENMSYYSDVSSLSLAHRIDCPFLAPGCREKGVHHLAPYRGQGLNTCCPIRRCNTNPGNCMRYGRFWAKEKKTHREWEESAVSCSPTSHPHCRRRKQMHMRVRLSFASDLWLSLECNLLRSGQHRPKGQNSRSDMKQLVY